MAKRIIGKRGGLQGRANARADIAKLRKAGLVSKGQGKTAKSRIQLRHKFRDVLSGKAKAVKVPLKEARSLRRNMRVKGDVVIVPKLKGERVKVDKTGRITVTRTIGGKKSKRFILAPGQKPPKAHKGKKFLYSVAFAGGSRVTYDSYDDLAAFMGQYDPNDKNYVSGNYKNWQQWMEVHEVDADEDDVEE